MKGLLSTEQNIKQYLNQNADVDWGKAGIVKNTIIQTNSIGKLKSRQHYVQIMTQGSDGNFTVYDPNGGQTKSMKGSEFEYCHRFK
ncbi:MAG: hypothetical protein EZS28_015744 [Streblomastix strix]|uniref:Uncharacterized protein n=1 Tax=Streblomastix strix TaxID=222440 RepID=A0A5J4W248_9EUKA|nr:MAG: hypothetical protein EZS28_015744 [Streblomastix strix]